MKIECPICHKSLECDSGWCGQKAQCPFCGNKFVISEIMLKPAAPKGRSKSSWVWAAAAAVLCVAAGVGLGHLLFGTSPILKPELNTTIEAKAESVRTTAPETGTADAEVSTAGANEKSESSAAADAATDENNTDASQASEQSSEETTTDDDETYTYKYYDGEWVPYYRGYYYIGGVWVWRKRGRAHFPPPRIRPALHSIKSPAKTAAVKTAPAKVVKSKPAPAKTASSRPAATGHSTTKPTASRPGPYKSVPAKSTTPVRRTTVRSTPHHGGGRVSAPRGPRR